MPYEWTSPARPSKQELRLWPHQSLPPTGFVAFIAVTATLVTLPMMPLLGTALLWGLLPFMALAIGAVWYAIHRNRVRAQVLEILTISDEYAHLVRHNPIGPLQEWHCNRYWTKPELHVRGGPVPQYVTLRGCGREVEIGAFLSETERVDLYNDLLRALRDPG